MTLHVSLAPAHRRAVPADVAAPRAGALCDPTGPRLVLGSRPGLDGLAQPIAPRADTLFGPRGACLAAPNGPLFVSDTGHHRVLVWTHTPGDDHAPADLLIGQPDFAHEGRNAKGEIGPTTLNVPTGIAAADGVLAVADAWNHRVLLWHDLPDRSNRPADVVVGQAGFASGSANRGGAQARADTLNWCYGVALLGGRLIVADTGNRRVLIWDGVPTRNGAAADLVLGQRDLVTRDENAGADAGALGMCWPHAVAVIEGAILVADAGNNRIMVWHRLPGRDGTPCDGVLGQADMRATDHNQAAYYPTAAALNMPYGLAVAGDRLVVADTANSRLLGFAADDLRTGVAATHLTGQPGFGDKGDNRWGPPTRDSLCWPYGVTACSDTLVIADSGNNRVLLWETAP